MSIIIPVAVVSGLGLFFGIGLAYASKVFAVKVDERIEKVREFLPGANCGACGFSGCDGLAEAIVNEGVSPGKCPVNSKEGINAIAELMGIDEGEVSQMVARVICQGTWTKADMKYEYQGVQDCHAANQLGGGMSQCYYGCIGLGSCQRACPFDAIELKNGLARIIPEKCKGCGMCVAECPKGIIRLVPVLTGFTVLCANQDKGGVARKNCKVACIGCMKCQKVCPAGAITVENNLARIDHEKCENCGKCAEVCPQSTIHDAMHERFPMD
ncbi:MAG TPA: Fe-S cluster domain-containing protein [Thermoclostridium caenicola]|uniref:Ion-translocating oxidoreductase complex subunit B n=1 Tax=Thermoclostridium caenicola TaxID=659425 RepID=A0A1M6BR45_9FIRM|nr:Fe-S cluster domain-containing protein [Thermoclostridium caenicola]SHI51176.1 electron transport complex, RnfABCDGE type, B subunit [Thermoclostridium caenicola]HOK42346.1 Fe-S cluster domain-containing protein [Thermoclostridium caenicola]HOL84183.1 Fe-S cluster domain-containing protein [Thermoclostridium caenicola]HOP71781.1 Fe-S cluster domain-containing protein [Thermoclostridium caenicola]HPO75951.1 Fe-S cluster domain-containing protein [Thermoclostridium caenicola]